MARNDDARRGTGRGAGFGEVSAATVTTPAIVPQHRCAGCGAEGDEAAADRLTGRARL